MCFIMCYTTRFTISGPWDPCHNFALRRSCTFLEKGQLV